jgi:hypothetical protein
MPPEICPNCGAEVPPRAKACPQCGSDEKTGWSDQAQYGSLDLPDEKFDYDEYVEREFGGKSPKPRGLNWFWWFVALLLVIALALVYLR